MIPARAFTFTAVGSDKSTTETCGDCNHGWHGLACRALHSTCPSAWKPLDDMDQA